MAIPARSDCNNRDPTVMAARVVNDAQLTWVAAEVESEHALRAWFGAVAPQRAGAYLAYPQRSTVRRRRPGICSGCMR